MASESVSHTRPTAPHLAGAGGGQRQEVTKLALGNLARQTQNWEAKQFRASTTTEISDSSSSCENVLEGK